MRELRGGGVLYHKNKNTKCIIKSIENNNLTVVLERSIDGKKELKIPIDLVGEYLFYSIYDINLDISSICKMKEYCKSKRVAKYFEKIRNENKARLREERRLEYENFLKRQKEIAIQEQIYRRKQEEIRSRDIIKETIARRNIRYLIHFTRVENLESILQRGIINRRVLEMYKIPYIKNDDQRLDRKENCTCFSVEFPNSYLLNSFKNKYPNSRWVVIAIDINLLLYHQGEKYFCSYNAASTVIRGLINNDKLKTGYDFERMFKCTEKRNRIIVNRNNGSNSIGELQTYLTTEDQAEILLSGIISPEFIKRIYFKDITDYKMFINTISDINLLNKFNFRVNSAYFKKREEVSFPERRKIIG